MPHMAAIQNIVNQRWCLLVFSVLPVRAKMHLLFTMFYEHCDPREKCMTMFGLSVSTGWVGQGFETSCTWTQSF